ncbi:hypothetical protein LTR37_020737 [Vermiconidia calcicola]|uniref:Uncharacterized protein n=1 Tax=Vermiconidia calcicola TaxID=1690605 RepID=A0ACC3MAF2_9PEZI|nr:hypothetical protein LTR37_020737 [Vermiconidia calcicola]
MNDAYRSAPRHPQYPRWNEQPALQGPSVDMGFNSYRSNNFRSNHNQYPPSTPYRQGSRHDSGQTRAPGYRNRHPLQESYVPDEHRRRDRSRSPSLRENRDLAAYRNRDGGRPQQAPEELYPFAPEFADVFLDADIAAGRRQGLNDRPPPYESAEYTQQFIEGQDYQTANGQIIDQFVELLRTGRIKPEDINGRRFRGMSQEDLKRIRGNWNPIGAQIDGGLYEYRYPKERFGSNIQQLIKDAVPGTIARFADFDSLGDDYVSIDDPNRINSEYGSALGKDRPVVIKAAKAINNNTELEVEVMLGTSFGNSRGEPPSETRDEYFQLVNRNALKEPADHGLPRIRFNGAADSLPKDTFVRFTHSVLVRLKGKPFKKEGEVVLEDWADMADLLSLGKSHELRRRGELLIAERELERETAKARGRAGMFHALEAGQGCEGSGSSGGQEGDARSDNSEKEDGELSEGGVEVADA